MAADERQPAETAPGAGVPAPPADDDLDDVRDRLPADIRNVSFPVSVRGYDRDTVDAYVKRANRVIAELEVSRSPQAAVRHALDRVGKQTVAVLQEARESADKLLEAARDEADAEKERAKAEAAKLVVNASDEADQTKAEADKVLAEARAESEKLVGEARTNAAEIVATAEASAAKQKQEAEQEIGELRGEAEARIREIRSDTQSVWQERSKLLDETQAMATRLQQLAAGAAARVKADDSAPSATDEQPTQITQTKTGKPAG
jgi:DivIVA domain-containing protein